MTEGPVYKPPSVLFDAFDKCLRSCGVSTLVFITIKDNSQKTRWTKIGKVNDWVRRYSKLYWIVKGTNGGTHFHVIASIEKGKRLRYCKGIHMHVRPLSDKKPFDMTREEIDEINQAKDTIDYLIKLRSEIYSNDICVKISKMIKKYWLKKQVTKKGIIAKQNKNDNIGRVYDYMLRNYNEPRDNAHREYDDYIIKYQK